MRTGLGYTDINRSVDVLEIEGSQAWLAKPAYKSRSATTLNPSKPQNQKRAPKDSLLAYVMAEARGFAPLYRRAATKASTRVSFNLNFASLDS